jgi:hypothetical protein
MGRNHVYPYHGIKAHDRCVELDRPAPP